MLEIVIHNMPEVRTDFSEQFEMIAQRKMQDVLDDMADGGKPPWERTKRGAIPRLYDRFAPQTSSDSTSQSATISVGGTPDTFLHHFGGDVFQVVTEKQRGFFWAMFYESDDEMWKWMALSRSLLSHHPARPLAQWYEEDGIWIGDILGDSLFVFDQTKGTQSTLTGGHA